KRRVYDYQTSPNEKRDVTASTRFAGTGWTVVIADMSQAVEEKRLGQLALVFDRLLPKGYARETFAGKKAHALDAARLAELATFGTMQPTSKFGEMFQYSNPMAAAAGFIAGHVLYPDLELGAAYDRAMQSNVFDPLGMTSTTFDFKRALAGDHAMPHAPDV